MARFPVTEEKLPEIGEALARAVYDKRARAAFKADPKAYLVAAGVEPKAIENLSFNVIEDSEETVNVVIPSALNTQKLAEQDAAYMKDLGQSVMLACAHTVEPIETEDSGQYLKQLGMSVALACAHTVESTDPVANGDYLRELGMSLALACAHTIEPQSDRDCADERLIQSTLHKSRDVA